MWHFMAAAPRPSAPPISPSVLVWPGAAWSPCCRRCRSADCPGGCGGRAAAIWWGAPGASLAPRVGYGLGRPRRATRLSDMVATVTADDTEPGDGPSGKLQTAVVDRLWSELETGARARLGALTRA